MSEQISQVQASQAGTVPSGDSTNVVGGGKGLTTETTISNVNDLKEKAPKIYKAMVEGIANQIIGQMRRRTDRLRKMMREGRRND